MTDQQQAQQDGEIPAIAPENPDQHKPQPDTQTAENEFDGPMDRLVTRFRRRRNFPWDRAINLFVAFIVTIGTAVGVASLASLNRSVNEMAKQTPEMIRSAKATEDGLAETKKATELTRDAMILGQRAWVGISQPVKAATGFMVNDADPRTPRPEDLNETGQFRFPIKYTLIFEITLRNFGLSAANKVITAVNLANGFKDIENAMERACRDAAAGKNASYTPQSYNLPPIDAAITGRALLPEQEMPLILRGDAKLGLFAYGNDPAVVLGCIKYVDVFAQTRTTRFCFHSQSPAGTVSKLSRFQQCWMLNDAE